MALDRGLTPKTGSIHTARQGQPRRRTEDCRWDNTVDLGDVTLSQEKLKPYVRTRMWDVELKLTDTDNDAGDQRAGLGAVKGAGATYG